MARIVMTLFLLLALIFPLVSLMEYCPAMEKHQICWPKISLGTNFTKDCSAINSSWTGKFTALCMKNIHGIAAWYFKEGCGCEVQPILLHYEKKVSQVNESNFMDTAGELRNALEKFINQNVYKRLLSRLKASICKKTPKLKSADWDQIQMYCQTGPTDLEKETQRMHFEKHFCQKFGSNNSLTEGTVFPSFVGGSGVRPKPGIGTVHVNESQAVNDALAGVNSSECTVMSYRVNNGTVTIIAKRNTVEDARKERHKERRERVELVLISVSLAAIILSLIVLSCIRTQSPQSAEKLFIHKNFLLSWGLGYAVYIVDVTAFENRNQWPGLCTAIAVVSHFFQTSLFTWMLVEAVNLFVKLVKVISTRTFYMTYLAIGWGIPAVIVGITAAARTKTYHMNQPINEYFMCGTVNFTSEVEQRSCWLNGSKWIYTGPVIAILVVNFVIFVMLIKVVFGKLGTKYQKDRIMKTRKGLKSVAVLLPLLGVTWLFGFFVNLHEVLDYIFIVLTSTQGMVFCVFHCLLDGQVRRAVSQRFKKSHTTKPVAEHFSRKTKNGVYSKQKCCHGACKETDDEWNKRDDERNSIE